MICDKMINVYSLLYAFLMQATNMPAQIHMLTREIPHDSQVAKMRHADIHLYKYPVGS